MNNPVAQRKLYDLFAGKMYFTCMRYAVDEFEAEDMLQEGFVKAFTKINKYTEGRSFGGWLNRLFANNCIDMLRKKPKLFAVSEDEARSIESDAVSALDDLYEEELLELIYSLPSGYKTIFNMYVIDGYSHKEISEKLNISEGTSKSQLNRARALLKKKILDLKSYELNSSKANEKI